jgi:hypothetical protein
MSMLHRCRHAVLLCVRTAGAVAAPSGTAAGTTTDGDAVPTSVPGVSAAEPEVDTDVDNHDGGDAAVAALTEDALKKVFESINVPRLLRLSVCVG